MKATNCKGCGEKTIGSSGYCRTCKGKLRRGARRAETEGILVDEAGGAWWAWDRIGNTLAGPVDTKGQAWIALAPEAA